MSKTKLPFAAVALSLLVGAASVPAFAHHADVMFDKMKEMTLTGTVKQFENTNPHSMIELVVQSAGKPVTWHIETDSPIVLQKVGAEPMLQMGEKVTMRIHPLKDGKPGGSLIQVKKSDGSVVMVPEPGKVFGTSPPVEEPQKAGRTK